MKKNELTEKQEKFCREYLLTGNASEAYRRAFDTSKMKTKTVWERASVLMAQSKVKTRITELREKTEELTGITKAKMLGVLEEVIQRSLKTEVKQVWDSEKKCLVPLEDSEGKLVVEYDSAGVNKAVDTIMKSMGYYAPAQNQTIGKDGTPVDPVVNYVIEIKGSKSKLINDEQKD